MYVRAFRVLLVVGLGGVFADQARAAAGAAPFLKTDATVQIELLAGRTAAMPGQTVELAIRFKIQPEWHVYWRNRGEGGLEPFFTWQLPEGYKIGPLQYPAPRRHVDRADAHTFILEGEPTFLTTLAVPATAAAGATATIGLEAQWLVCKEVCKPGEKSLTLRLPIVASPDEVKPAHEDVFKRARAEIPHPAEKAKHLRQLTAAANVDRVVPGSEFKVAVVAVVPDELHLNSSKPLDEYLIPTDVFNDAAEGLDIGRPVFPPGIEEPGAIPGEKISVYRGRTAIILPIRAEKSLKGDSVRVSGVITYQACSDKTRQCYPPTAAEWAVTLPIGKPGETAQPANTELFTGAATRPSPPQMVEKGPAGPSDARSGTGGGQGTGGGSPGAPNTLLQTPPDWGGTWLGRVQGRLASLGLIGYLIMAFAGGFILNLMPCVLPVISIKILSFVQQAKESRVRVFTLGVAFAAGILLSFIVLGILIVLLDQQWGGLFQMPQMVIGLAAVVTAFALSLFGVFALFPPKIVNQLGEAVPQEGHFGAFGMGLLATLLGTACTAPFLSAAISIATQQSPAVGVLIFVVAGLGMAIPYVLLAAKPAWLRLVPRPGPWMKEFEQVMGFAILATVAWLLNTVNAQLGGTGLLWTLVFLLIVAMAVWLRGRVSYTDPLHIRVGHFLAGALLVAVGWWLCFHRITTIPELIEQQREIRLAMTADWLKDPNWDAREFPWIEYHPDRVQQAVKSGRTVFIDYTAEWCANCKANEKLVIDTAEVRDAMRRLGVLPFRADFTSRDPLIKADLERHGRSGVPMYIVKPANQPEKAMVLDEILTQGSLIAALEQASAGGSAMTMK